MILSFKEQFVFPIKNGTKIHTIREDKANRWTKGREIHFWKGNPRNPATSYPFKHGTCRKVETVELNPNTKTFILNEQHRLYESGIRTIAFNDGFEDTDSFFEWFKAFTNDRGWFRGKLIHWTDICYVAL